MKAIGGGYYGWTSHFWPPLSSILIGFLGNFTSGFFAGKLISSLSSVAVLIFIYLITMEFTNKKIVAYLTQIFVAINPLFILSSIQVENHMLDTCFFVGSFYFLIKIINQQENTYNPIFLAIFTSLATLTRYTSYAIIPLIAIVFVFYVKKQYLLKNSLIFIVIHLSIVSPWYYYNYIYNGSPLHTWQYMNIGSHIYPGGNAQWWWSGQASYSSIGNIIIDYPQEYIANLLKNLFTGIRLSIKSIFFPLLLLFSLWFIYRKEAKIIKINYITNNKYIQIHSIGYFGYLFLVSQAFVFTQVFLSWIVLFTSMIFIIIFKFLTNAKKMAIFIISIALFNIGYTSNMVYKYCTNVDDNGQLTDYKEIAQILKKDDKIHQSYIMAVHPSRAYYSKSFFIAVPLYFNGTIDELVKYQGMPKKVKSSAPKYPSVNSEKDIKADYLICDSAFNNALPQYSFLFNNKSSKIPDNFYLVYKNKNVVVYKIK